MPKISETQDAIDYTNDKKALQPDPGTEEDFQIENNKFAFSPGQLGKLYNPKSLSAFYALGGLSGIEKGLRTNRKAGLSNDEQQLEGQVTFEEATNVTFPADADKADVEVLATEAAAVPPDTSKDTFTERKRVYKDNRLPEKKSKSFLKLAWIAYKDKILLLLTAAAVISLALGLYESLRPKDEEDKEKEEEEGPSVEWVEGVAIVIAIFIVVLVGALNDWQKERQFVRLNRKKEQRDVKVIRSGARQEISVYDVNVGDVMLLEPGDLIPVDGIFIEGHNVKCDESSATGESDLLRKHPGDDVYRALEAGEDVRKLDPFILSGAKVQEGVGTFLVTAVGIHSSYGKTMMSLRDNDEVTPLQSKLNKLAEYIAKLGGAAALLLLLVLLIKFLANLKNNSSSPSEKGEQFMDILIQAITVVVVAVPEGLPLAVTLALAFAMTRMIKQNNLVRVLRSCETMGNATTICSDKTGTLTQNKMSVVAGTLGTSLRFGDRKIAQSSEDGGDDGAKSNGKNVKETSGDDVSPAEFAATVSRDTKDVLKESIVLNSTAFESEQNGIHSFVGSKTETALLSFARDHLGIDSVALERSNANIIQLIPFDSARKCMAVVIKLPDGRFRMYVKGASEILLTKAQYVIDDPARSTSAIEMTEEMRQTVTDVIDAYASRSLRTIGLLYREFEAWPPKGARTIDYEPTQAIFEDVFDKMTLLGMVGIQDPLRPGVREAVADCQMAGVFVRMVTGDNLKTARAIAEDCGIFKPGGLILEGPVFRTYGKKQMEEVIPRLCVLARSSPEDKRILVKRLKEMGETVAVTGDGTNDAPALKTGDVGFSMGIAGTEVAKEASDIILMDDNFSSIVVAIMWGRAVNDAVRKFLLFQLTINITAVTLTFVSAVADENNESVLTAVQLLWVNLIMDTFAALALATDPPSRSILDRKPSPKSAPLISLTMWKMIIGQAIFQLVVTFILNFAGASILGYGEDQEEELDTLVFNTFVWMQIFKLVNSRRLDNKLNILEGITKNYFFFAMAAIMVAGQTLIIFIGDAAFQVVELDGTQWAISIILGSLSIPVGIIIRLIPDDLIRKLIPEFLKRKRQPTFTVTDMDERYEWTQPLVDIRDELAFLKRIRGGRLNSLKFKLQNPRDALLPRSRSGSRSSFQPHTPMLGGEAAGGSSGSPVIGNSAGVSAATASLLSSPQQPPQTPDSRRRARTHTRSRSNSAFAPAAAMAGIVAGSIAGWSPIDRSVDGESLSMTRTRSRSDLESQVGATIHPDTKPEDPIIMKKEEAGEVTGNGSEGAAPSQRIETTPAFGSGPFGGYPSGDIEKKTDG